MAFTIDLLKEFCLAQGREKTYWVAYSGGVDSHVLLHLLSKLRQQLPIHIKAIHIHHQLNSRADHWFEHCKKTCEVLSVDWVGHKINAKATLGESPEAVARTKRYAVFADSLAKDDILLTAHHQNDQAETLLLQLLRGSGPKGLAAMPPIKALGLGWHARPFLSVTHKEIMYYAHAHQLQWIEDDSNAQLNFSRNFLRHQVFPLLQSRWPTVTNTLARSAQHCAEVQQLLESFVQQDLQAAAGPTPQTLSIPYLKKLSLERQRLLLRTWLQQQNFIVPPAKKMQTILQTMLNASADKMPYVCWGQVELRRYRDFLYVEKSQEPAPISQTWQWDLAQPLIIPGVGTLFATPTIGQGLRVNPRYPLIVRLRSQGESIRLPGRTMHHELKKLLQTWGIPPWLRNRIPLIYINNELASIVGLTLADGFQAGAGETGYLLRWNCKKKVHEL